MRILRYSGCWARRSPRSTRHRQGAGCRSSHRFVRSLSPATCPADRRRSQRLGGRSGLPQTQGSRPARRVVDAVGASQLYGRACCGCGLCAAIAGWHRCHLAHPRRMSPSLNACAPTSSSAMRSSSARWLRHPYPPQIRLLAKSGGVGALQDGG